MVAVYTFRMRPELKTLLDKEADRESKKQERRVTLNEVASKILAEFFDKPELGVIARGTPGRRPGPLVLRK